ncbi:MAG: hypothetical protein D9C04_06290 [Nitrosopumilus sp. B06]|nr:MAG: hypothetical protein EB828_02745 [Nitrosopumilus sp. D6]RNJ78960.1 MAG: hypothetical protein D9C04_06290 [Nitrosopumilus sp. B06]
MDPLKARLDQIKKSADSAKRRASLYSELAGISDKHTASSLGALQKASAPGKKLQKIGFMMLWVPEPTGVTCAVGGPMIMAGRYLDKKYNGATIHDVGHETKNTLSSINDFKNTIM